jgi:hypothetical protein
MFSLDSYRGNLLYVINYIYIFLLINSPQIHKYLIIINRDCILLCIDLPFLYIRQHNNQINIYNSFFKSFYFRGFR